MCVYLNTLRQKFGLLSNLIEAKTKYMGLDLSCKSWNMEQFFSTIHLGQSQKLEKNNSTSNIEN